MLQVYTGCERYLIDRQIRKETERLVCPEMDCLKAPLNQDTMGLAYQYPFGGDDRALIVYECDSIQNPVLKELMADDLSNDVRVVIPNIDKRSSAYKSLEKKKAVRVFGHLNDADFETFLLANIKRAGLAMSEQTYRHMKELISYGARDDVDLTVVKGWINVLSFCEMPVTETVIDEIIPPAVEADAFSMFSALMSGNRALFFEHVRNIKEAERIPALGALTYQFRVAYKVALVGKRDAASRLGISAYQMRYEIPMEVSLKAIYILTDASEELKSGGGLPEMLISCSRIADLVLGGYNE